MANPLKIEVIGIVYRVSDADGGVLTDVDGDRVAAAFEDVGMEIESHESLRIDGTHVVAVVIDNG